MEDWKYLQRFRKSEKHHLMVMMAIVGAILAIAAIVCVIVKCCLRKDCGCCGGECDCDRPLDDDDYEDDDNDDDDGDEPCDPNSPANPADASAGCDENGCCYTNEKDFV